MNRVCLATGMRENSQRLPGKLLQCVGGRSLVERYMDVASDVVHQTGLHKHMVATHPNNTRIVDAVRGSIHDNCKLLWRSAKSMNGETCADIYDTWTEYIKEHWDWVLYLSPCFPFQKVEDIIPVVEHLQMRHGNKPLSSAFKRRGWIWNEHGDRVVGHGETTLNTKYAEPYWITAHVFTAYPTSVFGTPDMMNHMEPFEIPDTIEYHVDIDTADDLKMAHAVNDVLFPHQPHQYPM